MVLAFFAADFFVAPFLGAAFFGATFLPGSSLGDWGDHPGGGGLGALADEPEGGCGAVGGGWGAAGEGALATRAVARSLSRAAGGGGHWPGVSPEGDCCHSLRIFAAA